MGISSCEELEENASLEMLPDELEDDYFKQRLKLFKTLEKASMISAGTARSCERALSHFAGIGMCPTSSFCNVASHLPCLLNVSGSRYIRSYTGHVISDAVLLRCSILEMTI